MARDGLRRQAVALRAPSRRQLGVRVGAQGPHGAPSVPARRRSSGDRGLPRLRLRARPANRVEGRREARTRPPAPVPRRRPGATRRSLVGRPVRGRHARYARRRLRAAACAAHRVGAAAHDLGSAARCVPVGRRRLERGRRDDGRAVRGSGANVLDRVRRARFRRIPLRAARRRPVPDRPLRRDRGQRRLRPHRYPGRPVRRAVRRQLRRSRRTGSASWRASA